MTFAAALEDAQSAYFEYLDDPAATDYLNAIEGSTFFVTLGGNAVVPF